MKGTHEVGSAPLGAERAGKTLTPIASRPGLLARMLDDLELLQLHARSANVSKPELVAKLKKRLVQEQLIQEIERQTGLLQSEVPVQVLDQLLNVADFVRADGEGSMTDNLQVVERMIRSGRGQLFASPSY